MPSAEFTTPVIALTGRPNVGKSTLFNCLTKSRAAIVSDVPGLTRDRQYGHSAFQGRDFIVIDTGGLEGMETGIQGEMLKQAKRAIDEADIVAFIVDARDGLTLADEIIAKELRSTGKRIFLVANKIDGVNTDIALTDFQSLGFGNPIPMAAAHNRGIHGFLDVCFEILPPPPEMTKTEKEDTIKLAIVGKPNVGKSTLVNRMLGEERVVVYDQPGTTRDSIFIPLERRGKHYTLIDTAGVRRRKKVKETIEKFSVIKTLQAIDQANVVIMMIDAHENVSDQDLHLLSFIVESGRSLIIAINKWDGLDHDDKSCVKTEIARRLDFVSFAKVHFISALHGTGVGDLFNFAERAYDSAMKKTPSSRLTKILEKIVEQHPPPIVNGRRIKCRYAHPGGQNPPIIVIHGNQVNKLPKDYQRYVINTYRKALKLVGTPIRLELKIGENPYKDKRNKLTPRQLNKRKRMMKHRK